MISNGAKSTSLAGMSAVIFDMDGVVTDTARIHAAVWKQVFDQYLKERRQRLGEEFRHFDAHDDYHRYVDGKPRYDGVKSFLESRGISIPYGHPDDGPDEETVCGLGNRKNVHFLEYLKERQAEAYPSTVDLIKDLRARGIPTALISASVNARAVTESAGVSGLFDARVDGADSIRLGLKGKPDPAIFLEAARQLGVEPAKAAIIEDSLAGVEAGRRGGFKLVIGVDRTGQNEELKQRGADVVVTDLAQLSVEGDGADRAAERRSMRSLPSAVEKREEVFSRLREGTPAVFLDYDGTLTPIVEDPKEARLSDEARQAIQGLAQYWPVGVISGRDLEDVRRMVGIDDIVYSGSHGFDIAGVADPRKERWEHFLPALEQAELELRKALQDIRGAMVERKRFAIAVHYRKVDEADVNTVHRRFGEVLAKHEELRKSTGKKVLELRPDVDWDKGRALLWLIEALHADAHRAVPIYIGDDVTDEDAFRAIGTRGIAIAVGDSARQTAAHYRLQSPDEVIAFLNELAALAESEASRRIWTLAYDGFDPDHEGLREALCTLGNGYFATRGSAPESSADGIHYPGTYVAGCFNRLKDEIAGRTVENESMVNMPNWMALSFSIEGGAWFDLKKNTVVEHRQELDLLRGVLSRVVRFDDERGRRTRLAQRRFVSMADPHLAGLETTLAAENWSGELRVRSALDGRVANSGVERYRKLGSRHLRPVEGSFVSDEIMCLLMETNQTHIRIAETARTRLFCEGQRVAAGSEPVEEDGYVAQDFKVHLEEGETLTIEKIASLHTSRDRAISESGIAARTEVERAAGFDELVERHALAWSHLWKQCRINIKPNNRAAMILNLHIFHLLQTASPNSVDLDAAIPARGLHGEAYRGHIFWDELFVFPFLNLRIPDITRALLLYRYRRLPEARWAARQAGFEGAMYPWQSGSDGREETQTMHLNPRSGRWLPDNSHLQRHVNIAIAYNVWLYYQVTSDIDFLCHHGAEMLIEIARFWASAARHDQATNRYDIRGVMGPDEYHDGYPGSEVPGIDNNAYTNIMAVWVLCRALDAIALLPRDRREALQDKLALRPEETERWEDVSRKMRVVFHDDGIISQFEGYDRLEEFDWEGYRRKYGNIERLDRILEAEGDTANRYKVSKQADVLMLFYLLSADEMRELFRRLGYPFEYETIPRNVEYYLKRTSHGSTLSRLVHAWVLARSKRELSWHLFREALESDISDIQGGTTREGIHLGAVAGTVDLIQRCYCGIETRGDKLQLNPCLPVELSEISFDIIYRRHRLHLWITREHVKISSLEGDMPPIKIGIEGKTIELNPAGTAELSV